MSETAVVILNYNGAKLLNQFLPAVVQHTTKAKVIVADNGSTDNSLEVIRNNFPSVDIIELDKNYGFCGGYNRALQQIQADYFVLLNSDIEVTAHWLEPMIQQLDRNPDVAAVQPKILAYNEPHKFEYAGAAGGYIDFLGYPFCRGRILQTTEADHGQYNNAVDIFWASGAALMIRANVYHQFNGLDEDFFAHMEEIDLCWKIHRSGKRIVFCGDSTIYHLGAGTLGYASPRKTYLNFRNGLSLLYKHIDDNTLVQKMFARILLDWIAAFMFLLKGQTASFAAVFKAHAHFFNNKKRDQQKRKELHDRYPTYDKKCVYPRSIVWVYFINRKMTFDSLKWGKVR